MGNLNIIQKGKGTSSKPNLHFLGSPAVHFGPCMKGFKFPTYESLNPNKTKKNACFMANQPTPEMYPPSEI